MKSDLTRKVKKVKQKKQNKKFKNKTGKTNWTKNFKVVKYWHIIRKTPLLLLEAKVKGKKTKRIPKNKIIPNAYIIFILLSSRAIYIYCN